MIQPNRSTTGPFLFLAAALALFSLVPARAGVAKDSRIPEGVRSADAKAAPIAATIPVPPVEITTDSLRAAGCRGLGEASLTGDDGLALLRQEASRRGADVVFLTALSGRQVRGQLFRCAQAVSAERPALPGAAPADASNPNPKPEGVRPPPPPSPTPPSRPTPAPGPPRPPVANFSPSPRDRSTAPAGGVPAASSARQAAAERQRRAQEEFLGLQAAVRVTEDPKLVEGCEKRGEGRATGDDAVSTLRGDAVGQVANALLLHRMAFETSAEFFRCPARTLQAIPLHP